MPDVAEELNRIVSEGLDATLPSLDRLQRLERRRRRRRIVPGTVAALVSVIAIVAVVASAGGPPRRIPGRVTSGSPRKSH
jgi:triphosphoribosyl-dephospho-CoA synthetase